MADTKISAMTAASTLGGTELAAGVQSSANVKITINQIKTWTSNAPTLVTPALGTPASGTLTSCTGLPVGTGISGFGTGVATALAVNVGSAGAPVVNGGVLGTPSSGTATNLTGLPLTTGVTGTLGAANGGTGVANNAASTITISGSFATTLTVSGITGVTLPTTGTLATLAGSEALTNKSLNGMTVTASTGTFTLTNAKTLTILKTISLTAADDTGVYTLPTGTKTLVATDVATLSSLASIGTITTGTWTGSVIGPAYGGTGVANNAASTLTISGNFTTTLTVSGTTSVTLPTSGTLVSSAVATLSSLVSVGTLTTGAINWAGAIASSAAISTSLTTDSTSTTTGALLSAGGLGVAKKAFLGTGLDVAVVDANATAVLIHGTSKALRMYAETTGFVIEGVDNTGVGSFQPLTLGGSVVNIATVFVVNSATAIPAGGAASTGVMLSTTAGFGMYFGSGAPSVSAAKGSIYLRSDGTGVADRAYINTNGSTTWTAIATAG